MSTLPKGYMLNWFRIESVLGRGSFGITYLAIDTNLRQQVAIKEFMPQELSIRSGTEHVEPIDDKEARKTYAWGLSSFVAEARTLSKFEHPNIVNVLTVFEANGTAYLVMKYEPGVILTEAWKQGEVRDEATLRNLLTCIADGLQDVHRAGFIHRDIKPGNIYLRERSGPVLLDFGSARQQVGANTRHQLTTLYTPGYAPIEQYDGGAERSQQGPFTDIYSLGATIYHGICGRGPIDAMSRASAVLDQRPDPLQPLATREVPGFSAELLHLVDSALGLRPGSRPQTIEQWLNPTSTAVFAPAPQASSTGSEETVILGRTPGQLESPNRAVSDPVPTPPLAQTPKASSTAFSPSESVDPLQQISLDSGHISADPTDRNNTARPRTHRPREQKRSPAALLGGIALVAALGSLAIWQKESWYPLVEEQLGLAPSVALTTDSATTSSTDLLADREAQITLQNGDRVLQTDSPEQATNTQASVNHGVVERAKKTSQASQKATSTPASTKADRPKTQSRTTPSSSRVLADDQSANSNSAATVALEANRQTVSQSLKPAAAPIVSDELEIEGELNAAARYFTAGQITSPADANARDSYLRVLALQPGHPDAERGLTRLLQHYEQQVETALWQNRLDTALAHATTALTVAPGHAPSAKLANEIYQRVLDESAVAATVTPANTTSTELPVLVASSVADPAPVPEERQADATTPSTPGQPTETSSDPTSRQAQWLKSFGVDAAETTSEPAPVGTNN